MTPAAVFGDDYDVTPYYTFQYSPSTGYTVPTVLNMGQGYWLGSNSAQAIDAEGTPISSANLNLAAGFNIIGNPFATSLLKNDLRFTDGSLVKNIVEAASANWLSNILYGYDGTSYYTEDGTLDVWKGYWIPMLVNGISILYSPTVSVPTPKTEDVNFTPGNWDVKINAAISREGVQYGDHIASFGVREDATVGFDVMYDAPRPPRSPAQDYVEVIFPVSDEGYPSVFGSNYASDYRPSDAAKWEFTVKTSTEGIVELNWDNAKIKALPEEVQIILFDKLNCSTIDMKKSDSYTYYQEGTTHLFMINNSSTGIGNEQKYPDTYMLSQNYPNPFNPATTISFGLPNASYVTLDIYNSLGQKVSQVVNGKMDAGYHTVKFDASQLSSGIYIYRLTATQENVTPAIISKKMILMK